GNISLNLSGLRGHSSPRWVIFSATSGQMFCRGMSSIEEPSSACQLLVSRRHNPTAIKICAKQRKEYNMPTTPVQPILIVNQPKPNSVVGLNQSFQITGQVTDRGGSEPIMIDSVTVQIDGGPLIDATLKTIPNKTLTEVSFHASAQISSGNDPHTVTV